MTFNPLLHMPSLGSSNAAAHKDMMPVCGKNVRGKIAIGKNVRGKIATGKNVRAKVVKIP